MSHSDLTTADPSHAALHWLARINEQPEVAHSAAFKRWLLADPRHREAYAQAQALWHKRHAWPRKNTQTCNDTWMPWPRRLPRLAGGAPAHWP